VRLLGAYPALPFVLIGDSGQQDAEFYAALVHEYPAGSRRSISATVSRKAARLRAIYALARGDGRGGDPMMLVADSLALAHDAARRGCGSRRRRWRPFGRSTRRIELGRG
jgi:hypothetical protein